jgi:hypothetical protein
LGQTGDGYSAHSQRRVNTSPLENEPEASLEGNAGASPIFGQASTLLSHAVAK